MTTIPFNKPYLTGREHEYVVQAMTSGKLEGDGPFTAQCQLWLERWSGAPAALMTHSCTGALEMTALLLEIESGDEVIMPSFTFSSTANAVALRGGVPVFVDVRPDTLNLDERLVSGAITPRTRAIFAVHYAGVACDMDTLLAIAGRHGLAVVEDAAQCLLAAYRGRPLGSIGQMGALSFHATKNVISGEGGALLLNDPKFAIRAEMIREKGTDRKQFLRGEVDKYTWQDLGSSYLPGELSMAFLLAQLEAAQDITRRRMQVWNRYHAALDSLEREGRLGRPTIPEHCEHNAHIYYVLLPDELNREELLTRMRALGVRATSHYVPLHSAPAGVRYGRAAGEFPVTNRISRQIVRLPLWAGMTEDEADRVIAVLRQALG